MALLPPMASYAPLLLLLTTIPVLLLVPSSHAQALFSLCSNSAANYTANSTFQTNLNNLFISLTSTNASTTGYSSATVGNIPDRVSGLVLCRGDVTISSCRSCLTTAVQDVQQICGFTKSAVIWYDDCLLRYSNQSFLSTIDTNPKFLRNTQNVTSEHTRFNESVVTLLNGLKRYAAYNTSAPPPMMFATGTIGFNNAFPIIYGLVQCTMDLSADDCNQCLTEIIADWTRRFSRPQGGRVLSPSCNFRYEIYPFFNISARLTLPPLPTTSPLAPPTLIPTTNGTNSTDSIGNKKTRTILAIAIPLVTALIIFLICCTLCLKQKGEKKKYHIAQGDEIGTIESLLFDLSTVRDATDNFSESNKLGEGGFGAVYKGMLPNGQEIAVKRLSTGSGQGLNELRNEVVLLAKLQHRNLVRLLGVCLEEEEKLLVYEYVQNKSLDTFLFDPTKKEQLYWERRYKIIGGIARGLLYLHEESQVKIIHRDLKASNILLDSDMNPKIADFGIARLFDVDQTQASTNRVVGTFGYMAPEYAMRGQFSIKADVFSFGVLVLEIVTGRKNSDFFSSENSTDLLNYVWQHWTHGTISDVVDPSFSGNCPQSEALRCIQIGLLCVQESPADRPTMSSVVLMLDSYTVSLSLPSQPAFLVGYSRAGSFQGKNTGQSEGTQQSTKSEIFTPNEISITELDPR